MRVLLSAFSRGNLGISSYAVFTALLVLLPVNIADQNGWDHACAQLMGTVKAGRDTTGLADGAPSRLIRTGDEPFEIS